MDDMRKRIEKGDGGEERRNAIKVGHSIGHEGRTHDMNRLCVI